MKKFLVVLLALAMVFAIATTAMAADKQIPDYNDTKTSTEYAVDIYRLTALGVLEGNTGWGGAYRPNDNLTRAEFAKIACFMFGKQDYKDYYAAQKSAFSDVPEGHWAEGWINCANDNGLMIGIGGGKFAPEANVTKQEVATVTLRGVGYDDNLPGEWPADYIAKSQEVHTWYEENYKDGLSLFDYVEKIDGTAATRAEMAAIVNYCLELFRVEYVGDQTMIAGLSSRLGVDKDGYMYLGAPDTNELTTTSWLNGPMSEGTTLLWDVFKAWTEPLYTFARWDYDEPLLVEAAGWGYEDFDEYGFDELVFSGDDVQTPYSSYLRDSYQQIVEETAVASDYYIFDQYLDGELWQLGGRVAALTLQYNRKAYNKCEAVFAEMLSDVEYDAKANEDVHTFEFDGETYEQSYNYDEFAHLEFAIVNDVKKGDIATVDVKEGFGEFDEPGTFCLLDDCDTHDKNYVFLKDGKLTDASCLELNDVVYNAGELNNTNPDYPVFLYIVISPEKASLDELVYRPDEDSKEPDGDCPEGDLRQANIDGVDYWFCEAEESDETQESTVVNSMRSPIQPSESEDEEETEIAGYHQLSLDGGYTAGSYIDCNYDDLYDKLTGGEKDIRFAPAYAKKYVATIIFGASSENKKYGVLTNVDPDHVGHWYAGAVDFFGPDGKQTGLQDLDKAYKVGSAADDPDDFPAIALLGTLTNYFLTDDDLVITNDPDDEEFNWIKYTPGSNDIGYIALGPAPEEKIAIETSKDGKFTKDAAQAIDDAVLAMGDDELVGLETLGDCESAKGKKITADTIIFEITAEVPEADEEEPAEDDSKAEDGEEEGGEAAAENMVFKSVKLGDNDKYIDAEFTADQFVIFAWDDKDVTVLYVVNPSFAADEQIGLFDINRADQDGGFVKYMEDGTKIYFNDNAAKDYLPDTDYVYAAYKAKDGKLDQVIEEEATYGPEITAGDFVVLVTADGWFIDKDSAKAIIIAKVEDADEVSDIMSYEDAQALIDDELEVADDCVFIDLVKGKEYSFDGKISHDANEDYGYILVTDDAFNLIQVIRVNADAIEEAEEGGEGGEDEGTFTITYIPVNVDEPDPENWVAYPDLKSTEKVKEGEAPQGFDKSSLEGTDLSGYAFSIIENGPYFEDAALNTPIDITTLTADATVYVAVVD